MVKSGELELVEANVPLDEPLPTESRPNTKWRDAAVPGWHIGEEPAHQPSSWVKLWLCQTGGKPVACPIEEHWYLSVDLAPDGKRLLVVDGYDDAMIECDLATGALATLKKSAQVFQAAYAGLDHVAMLTDKATLILFARTKSKLKEVARVSAPRSGRYRVMCSAFGGRVIVLPGNRSVLVAGTHDDELAIIGKAAYPDARGKLGPYSEASRRGDGRVYVELSHTSQGEKTSVVYAVEGIADAYRSKFGEDL